MRTTLQAIARCTPLDPLTPPNTSRKLPRTVNPLRKTASSASSAQYIQDPNHHNNSRRSPIHDQDHNTAVSATSSAPCATPPRSRTPANKQKTNNDNKYGHKLVSQMLWNIAFDMRDLPIPQLRFLHLQLQLPNLSRLRSFHRQAERQQAIICPRRKDPSMQPRS